MSRKRLTPYRWKKRKKEVFERYEGKCAICRSTYMLDVHHIVKRSKGGSDDMSNLILLCRTHHNAAHPEKQVRFGPLWKRKEAVEAFNAINEEKP